MSDLSPRLSLLRRNPDQRPRSVSSRSVLLHQRTTYGLVCHVKWQMVPTGSSSLGLGSSTSKRNLNSKLTNDTSPATEQALRLED